MSGYTQMPECTYFADEGGNQTEIILILYVDDLLLMGNDLSMINKIKKKLGEAYHMKDLGAAQSYLGIRITRDRAHQRIWIDQEAYIDSALKRFGRSEEHTSELQSQ